MNNLESTVSLLTVEWQNAHFQMFLCMRSWQIQLIYTTLGQWTDCCWDYVSSQHKKGMSSSQRNSQITCSRLQVRIIGYTSHCHCRQCTVLSTSMSFTDDSTEVAMPWEIYLLEISDKISWVFLLYFFVILPREMLQYESDKMSVRHHRIFHMNS